jgi:hypothetical protein
VIESTWDLGSFAREARILRSLVWFDLLEYSLEEKDRAGRTDLYQMTQEKGAQSVAGDRTNRGTYAGG